MKEFKIWEFGSAPNLCNPSQVKLSMEEILRKNIFGIYGFLISHILPDF